MAAFSIGKGIFVLAWSAALVLPQQNVRAQAGRGGGDETIIFGMIVSELARSAYGEILVDPRTLASGADLTSVEGHELGVVSSEREEVLARMGVRTTAFLTDQECLFASGTPLPPGYDNASEEVRARRRQCRARAPFTSAVVGGTHPAGDTVAVRVVEVTTSRYAVREFVLHRAGPGRWCVARADVIFEIQA